MQTNQTQSEFLTIAEASLFMKVKVSTLYAWVYQRKIPFRKHGSRVVFEAVELRAWSEKRKVPEYLSKAWEETDTCGTTASVSSEAGSLKTRRTVETP